MPTQVDTLKRGLSRQIAGEVSYAKATDVVESKGGDISSQAHKTKTQPKKNPKNTKPAKKK
jgi:hypothetical protein